MRVDSDNRVQVYVETQSLGPDVLEALVAAGLTVERVAGDPQIVQGLFPSPTWTQSPPLPQ